MMDDYYISIDILQRSEDHCHLLLVITRDVTRRAMNLLGKVVEADISGGSVGGGAGTFASAMATLKPCSS